MPEIDAIIGNKIDILDHGFIRLIDYMGDDSSIVQAARVSYGKGTKSVSKDAGLIKYLMRHKHTTPFEMCDIKLHIKCPIFVARQWLRHRTASVNEYSARYSIMEDEFYCPKGDKIGKQSTSNNQGRESNDFCKERIELITSEINNANKIAYMDYDNLMNSCELTRELARSVLNLNVYTQFYWKINLHNLLHFLRLRADSHSQYEIRVYAEAILDIVKKWVPLTYDAYVQYYQDSVNLSKNAFEVVKKLINGEQIEQKDSNLSKREWQELQDIL